MQSLEEKLTTKWYRDYSHKLHMQRLKEIKSHASKRIDNSAPRTKEKFLYQKQGKDFLEKEKKKSITRNNQQLLKILTEITAGKRETVTQKILNSTQNTPTVKSLNITVRKKEARRIDEDNEALVRRLHEKSTELSAKRFNDEWELISKYRESISKKTNRHGTSHLDSRGQAVDESIEKGSQVRESENLSKTLNSINLPSIQKKVKKQMKNHDNLSQIIEQHRRKSEEAVRQRRIVTVENMDFKRNQRDEKEKDPAEDNHDEEVKEDRRQRDTNLEEKKSVSDDQKFDHLDEGDYQGKHDKQPERTELDKKNELSSKEVLKNEEKEQSSENLEKDLLKEIAKTENKESFDSANVQIIDKDMNNKNYERLEKKESKDEINTYDDEKKTIHEDKSIEITPEIKIHEIKSIIPEKEPIELENEKVSDETLASITKTAGELLLKKDKLKSLLKPPETQTLDLHHPDSDAKNPNAKENPENLSEDYEKLAFIDSNLKTPKLESVEATSQKSIPDHNSDSHENHEIEVSLSNPINHSVEHNEPSSLTDKIHESFSDHADSSGLLKRQHAKELKPEIPEESFEKIENKANEDLSQALFSKIDDKIQAEIEIEVKLDIDPVS